MKRLKRVVKKFLCSIGFHGKLIQDGRTGFTDYVTCLWCSKSVKK